MIDDMKAKLRYIFAKLKDNKLKDFITSITDLRHRENLSKFLNIFFISIEKKYKETKIDALKKEKYEILKKVNINNVDAFIESDEYERLRRICEEYYILENGRAQNFVGVSISLHCNDIYGCYVAEIIPNILIENNIFANNNNNSFYDFDGEYKDSNTRQGTEEKPEEYEEKVRSNLPVTWLFK